ncbi:MAG: hypothetical protein ACRDYX_19740 [Egibacteraceae bacterium]
MSILPSPTPPAQQAPPVAPVFVDALGRPLADWGERLLAFLIDQLLLAFMLAIVGNLLAAFGSAVGISGPAANEVSWLST